jgi:hypothetical protein
MVAINGRAIGEYFCLIYEPVGGYKPVNKTLGKRLKELYDLRPELHHIISSHLLDKTGGKISDYGNQGGHATMADIHPNEKAKIVSHIYALIINMRNFILVDNRIAWAESIKLANKCMLRTECMGGWKVGDDDIINSEIMQWIIDCNLQPTLQHIFEFGIVDFASLRIWQGDQIAINNNEKDETDPDIKSYLNFLSDIEKNVNPTQKRLFKMHIVKLNEDKINDYKEKYYIGIDNEQKVKIIEDLSRQEEYEYGQEKETERSAEIDKELCEEELWRRCDENLFLSGAIGKFADQLNGKFEYIRDSNNGGGSLFRNSKNSTHIEYLASCKRWQIKATKDIGKDICYAYLDSERPFPLRDFNALSGKNVDQWWTFDGSKWVFTPTLKIEFERDCLAEQERKERLAEQKRKERLIEQEKKILVEKLR